MELIRFIQSGIFKKALWSIGCLALAFLIFNAGMAVGFQKGSFSERMEQDYSNVFGGARGKSGAGFFSDDLRSGHGAAGKIVKINLPTLTIADRDGTEKVILITDDTSIRESREAKLPSDLSENGYIIAIGSPNSDGQIEARLVRMLPPPAKNTGTATSSQRRFQPKK